MQKRKLYRVEIVESIHHQQFFGDGYFRCGGSGADTQFHRICPVIFLQIVLIAGINFARFLQSWGARGFYELLGCDTGAFYRGNESLQKMNEAWKRAHGGKMCERGVGGNSLQQAILCGGAQPHGRFTCRVEHINEKIIQRLDVHPQRPAVLCQTSSPCLGLQGC